MRTNWLHPGFVVSIRDGDLHYVGVAALTRLNRLDQRTVRVWDLHSRSRPGDYHWFPRPRGDYGIPDVIDE